MWTPLALVKSITGIDECDVWLSNICKAGLTLEAFEYFMKCSIFFIYSSAVIRPIGVARPRVAAGNSVAISCFTDTLGKIIAGGRANPNAIMM